MINLSAEFAVVTIKIEGEGQTIEVDREVFRSLWDSTGRNIVQMAKILRMIRPNGIPLSLAASTQIIRQMDQMLGDVHGPDSF